MKVVFGLLTLLSLAEAFGPALVRPSTTTSFGVTGSALKMSTTERESTKTTPSLSSEEENILFGSGSEAVAAVSKVAAATTTVRTALLPPVPAPPFTALDQAKDPLVNQLREMREGLTACPHLWLELAKLCPNQRALLDEHLCDTKLDVTFGQMSTMVQKSAAVFQELGVTKGRNVAILGENSARWLMADHGIQLAGGASAVRGADAPLDELRYIYEHSDSCGIVVLQGPKLLKKLFKDAQTRGLEGPLGLHNQAHGSVRTVVLLNKEKTSDDDIAKLASEAGVKVAALADLIETAEPIQDPPTLARGDLSTIVYTSGTTGNPKGVMLAHGNLIHQMGHRVSPSQPFEETEPLPGDISVVLLPVWHITERMFELWMASRGSSIVYSSIRTFKQDLAKYRPQFMVLVPRVLEKVAAGVQDKFNSGSTAVKTLVKVFTNTGHLANKHKKIAAGLVVGDEAPSFAERAKSAAIVKALAPFNAVGEKLVWSKVQDGFGGRLKLIISGGSALAGSLETFYETAGLKIIVGYGLTECSPLISFRRGDTNLVSAGCVGFASAETELRVVDPDVKPTTDAPRRAVPTGQVGVVLARGPQIMQGYYKNPAATAAAIDAFGFFDTGDLGRVNPATGDLILTGRAKDTIVLSNGENVEPTPIEDAILGATSPLVEQVMLTGQDGRRLVAVTVLSPKELANMGYLSKQESIQLQAANEKCNDPKCTPEVCAESAILLNEAADKLRSNAQLKKELAAMVNTATSTFQKWERVGDVFLTLEPFCMSNGQLTQSYKVKRQAVMDRYQDSLTK